MKRLTLILFILIILLASILRLWNLGEMPPGITNDEAGIIYSSYSIWETGHDVSGKLFPLSFNLDNSFSPVYIYLTAPFVGLLGISPLTGRLPFALLGIGSVILIFLISRELFKNEKIALLSSLIMAVSPWHLQVSRGAWDAGVALFFILLSMQIFIAKIKKGNYLWSLPFFILAFYSYHATKIFIIPLIFLLLFIYKDYLLQRRKKFMIFISVLIFMLLSFIYLQKSQDITRGGVLLTNNIQSTSRFIDWERDKNTAPYLLRTVFSNKPLYFLRVIRENYLEAFSPQFFFLYGETSGLSSLYGVSFRGVMYIIELPLLILGFAYLLNYKKKREKYLIIIMLLISPLSSAFTTDRTYVMRSIAMLPFIIIITSIGLYYLLNLISALSISLKRGLLMCLILIYSFLVVEYLYQYHFRYNIYGAEAWFQSNKELFFYLDKYKKQYKNIYISEVGNMFLLQYAVFNKTDPKLLQEIWSKSWPKKIGNVNLINGCFDGGKVKYNPNYSLPDKALYIVPDKCHKDFAPLEIISDKGEPLRTIWKIYKKTI